jgi:hypothetical protein
MNYWLHSLQMCLIFHGLVRQYHISHGYVHSRSCRSVNKYNHRISILVVLRTIIINKQCTIHSPNGNNTYSRLQPDHCILDNTTLGYVDGIKHWFQNVHFVWWIRKTFVYKSSIRNYVQELRICDDCYCLLTHNLKVMAVYVNTDELSNERQSKVEAVWGGKN